MSKPALSVLLAVTALMILGPAVAARAKRASVSAAEVNGTFEKSFKGGFQRSRYGHWALKTSLRKPRFDN